MIKRGHKGSFCTLVTLLCVALNIHQAVHFKYIFCIYYTSVKILKNPQLSKDICCSWNRDQNSLTWSLRFCLFAFLLECEHPGGQGQSHLLTFSASVTWSSLFTEPTLFHLALKSSYMSFPQSECSLTPLGLNDSTNHLQLSSKLILYTEVLWAS